MRKIDAATLVGLSCHLGTSKAIELAEFAKEVNHLSDIQQKMLMRGWLAIEHLPKDASLEASDLYKCLSALGLAWQSLAFEEKQQAAKKIAIGKNAELHNESE